MDRDEKGRFGAGNPGGPGRPKRKTEITYMNLLMEECDLEDWKEVIRACVEDAKKGDPKAREWLARHLIGNPEEKAPNLTACQLEILSEFDPVLVSHARKLVFTEGEIMFSPFEQRIYAIAQRLLNGADPKGYSIDPANR